MTIGMCMAVGFLLAQAFGLLAICKNKLHGDAESVAVWFGLSLILTVIGGVAGFLWNL